MNTNFRLIFVAIFAVTAIPSIAQNGFDQEGIPFAKYIYASSFSELINQESFTTNIRKPKTIGTIYLIVRSNDQDRKRAKILGLSGLVLLATSPLISKVNKDIGFGAFITGCSIAPVAVYFGIRSRKH